MRIVKVLFCIVILSFLIGCGTKPKLVETMPKSAIGDQIRSTPGFVREGNSLHAIGGRADEISYMNDGLVDNSPQVAEEDQRMVISSAFIRIESQTPDTVHARVIDMAAKYKGYVLSSANASTSIRIPAVGYRSAIKEVELLGNVKDEKLTGEDITDDYKDLQTRLESAEKSRTRYLALLDKANSVSEILSIEREIERLDKEIEMYKGRLGRLSHLVQYATITVTTVNEIRPGPAGYLFYGLYSGIKWLFVWD
jgi:hypothetical protein